MTEAQATFLGAISTFITGIAAVYAAARVGTLQVTIQSRQAAIAERQSRILDRQTALAELTLRHDLFEKRFEVYRATREFLIETLSLGFPSETATLSPQKRAFLEARDKARFLFRPSVAASLSEMWDEFVAGVSSDGQLKMRSFDDDNEFMSLHAEQTKRMRWFGDRLENVVEIFGSELRLSGFDMQLG